MRLTRGVLPARTFGFMMGECSRVSRGAVQVTILAIAALAVPLVFVLSFVTSFGVVDLRSLGWPGRELHDVAARNAWEAKLGVAVVGVPTVLSLIAAIAVTVLVERRGRLSFWWWAVPSTLVLLAGAVPILNAL